MFLAQGHDVIDFDLDLLVEVLGVIDRQLAALERKASESPDPDGFGYYCRMEGIIGLGFVACQQYINATYGQLGDPQKKKWDVIAAAPRHSEGRSFAEIVNAAANFWKHHDEWTGQRSDEARTREVLESLVSSTNDYVMCNVLTSLVQPEEARFSSLVYQLTLWRDLQIKPTV